MNRPKNTLLAELHDLGIMRSGAVWHRIHEITHELEKELKTTNHIACNNCHNVEPSTDCEQCPIWLTF